MEATQNTLTYSQLADVGARGERLHHWRSASPSLEAGLGLRVLNLRWAFIPAAELQADPALADVIGEICK